MFKMKPFISLLILLALTISGCATNKAKKTVVQKKELIEDVRLVLPTSESWSKVTDENNGKMSNQEWVPQGYTGESTEWIVGIQKFKGLKIVPYAVYIKGILQLSKQTCTDTSFRRPLSISLAGNQTVFVNYICAQQKGKDYGTMTYQRFVKSKTAMYVITSELRLPPTKKAGQFSLPGADRDFILRLAERFKKGHGVAMKNVQGCFGKPQTCVYK